VLLVDDEEMVRRTGKRMLEAAGFNVIVADGGAAAVAVFERQWHCIDVVLLDLSMPGMSGAECFEELRQIDRETPVLIHTGHDNRRDADRMIARGAVGVLHKPLVLERLSQAIAHAANKTTEELIRS